MLTLIHVLFAEALGEDAYRVFFIAALIAGFLAGIFDRKKK